MELFRHFFNFFNVKNLKDTTLLIILLIQTNGYEDKEKIDVVS